MDINNGVDLEKNLKWSVQSLNFVFTNTVWVFKKNKARYWEFHKNQDSYRFKQFFFYVKGGKSKHLCLLCGDSFGFYIYSIDQYIFCFIGRKLETQMTLLDPADPRHQRGHKHVEEGTPKCRVLRGTWPGTVVLLARDYWLSPLKLSRFGPITSRFNPSQSP